MDKSEVQGLILHFKTHCK